MGDERLQDKIVELESIIENLSYGIYITDGEGNTLRVNPAYEAMSGLKQQELVGKNMVTLVKEGYFSESASLIVIKSKAPATVLYRVKTGKHLLARGIPVFSPSGKIIRIVNSVWDITELLNLQAQLERNKSMVSSHYHDVNIMPDDDFVCQSKSMQQVIEIALRVAAVNSTVLILGESGVGKEIIARFIHNASNRAGEPFIRVNCAAIPENLIESELFGYEKGSFTGALREGKAGLFETAAGGSIFLDEIGEMQLHVQAKLLRVLQDMEVTRVGGVKPIKINARIIAATNQNLKEMVKEGRFRQDLYYRLNVLPIMIPPLAERVEDIEPLVIFFLSRFNKKYHTEKTITDDAMQLLKCHAWPGNVRELENFVERMVAIKAETVMTRKDIDELLMSHQRDEERQNRRFTLKENLERIEKEMIFEAISKYRTTRRAAEVLGIDQSTLVRKMAKYKKK